MQGDQHRVIALKNYRLQYFDWCSASKVNKKMLDMPEVRIHLSESVVVESL